MISWAVQLKLFYAYLVCINLTTFVVYGFDKFMAVRRKRRISEKTLHLLALAGGTPAAFTGQLAFRHKTRKRKFQFITIATAALQVTAIAVYYVYIKK